MERPFRIVQLSDLHLSDSDSDSRIEPKIRGKLTGMNARFRRLLGSDVIQGADVILVTGDVTDTGNIAGWNHFWGALRERNLLGKVHVLVGNHDVAHMGLLRFVIPRKTKSLSRGRYMRGLRLGGAPVAYPWSSVVNEGAILIAALRSTMEGNYTSVHNALGRVPTSQLQKLRTILRDNRHLRHKIVALHHPPIFPSDGSVSKFLHDIPEEEGRKLIDTCLEFGVELILHGHMHQYMDQTVGSSKSSVRIIGTMASTQPVDAHRDLVDLCVYDFVDDGFVLSRVNI